MHCSHVVPAPWPNSQSIFTPNCSWYCLNMLGDMHSLCTEQNIPNKNSPEVVGPEVCR